MANVVLGLLIPASPLVWWWRRLSEWMDDVDNWTQERDV